MGATYRIIRELLTELGNGWEIFHIGSADAIPARKWIVGLFERLRVAKRVVRSVERLGLDRAFDEIGPVPRERLYQLGLAENGEDTAGRYDVEEMFGQKLDARDQPCRRYRTGVLWRPQKDGVIAQCPADARQHDVKRWRNGRGWRRPDGQPKRLVGLHLPGGGGGGWEGHMTPR